MEDQYIYNLGQLFKTIANKNSNNTAIKTVEGELIEFGLINSFSNKIANYLLELGIQKNDVVGIFNDKTYISYSLMIACLKIGATYTNLDPKSPEERFKKMFNLCKPKILFIYPSDNPIFSIVKNKKTQLVDYTSEDFKYLINLQNKNFTCF